MKILFLFLLLIPLLSCSNLNELNERLYEVQKKQIQQSPYKSASRMFERIKAQRKFRTQEIPYLLKEKLFQQKALVDTLLVFEDFDEICFNCPSDRMQVLYQDTVYFVERKNSGNKVLYSGQKVKLDTSLNDRYLYHEYHELVEIKNKMKRKEDWLLTPLEYGSDGCLDGNHSLMTAIFPNGKIETIYVRCWWPEYQRRLRNK